MKSIAFIPLAYDKNDSHDTKYEEYYLQNCNGVASIMTYFNASKKNY